MSRPERNDPSDESQVPWDESEDRWKDNPAPPPWLPSSEEGNYWKSPEDVSRGPAGFSALYKDFTDIPAWRRAHRYALKVAQVSREVPRELQQHPALANLRRQSYLTAVDIACGHDEGYGPGRREAHLKRCRQGLTRIHQCLFLLDRLEGIGALSAYARRELFDKTIAVRDAIVHWMEQLRCR